jgi:leucyl/phenylalanyl-tRNA---protein transferase
MDAIQRIDHHSLDFPNTQQALSYPNGLLAIGGDLSVPRLLKAYERGIFPWYEDSQPIMWWSPDPRSVLFPDELRISRSLRKALRQSDFQITTDRAFQRVVAGCAAPRQDDNGTWITNAMGRAYMELHRLGYAHSVEVWSRHQKLVGGLYGVALGEVFFGESMFSKADNASKMALVAATQVLKERGYKIIDCQVESEHLASLGARSLARLDFEKHLAHTVGMNEPTPLWTLDLQPRELL